MIRLRRTLLYVPSDNPRALAKAAGLHADLLIIDLEDAVAPVRKDSARAAARDMLDDGDGGGIMLRINPVGTFWHEADIALAAAAGAGIVLPKVRSAADVQAAAALGVGPVWPMIETAEGVLRAHEIAVAAAATGDAALVLGTNDLAAELRVRPGRDRAELAVALQLTVLAGRAAGLDVIDGVFNDITDVAGLVAEAETGCALGMAGKCVIHPGQIGPVNAVFTPDEAAVAAARAVIAALDEARRAGRVVATLDGRLVEELHADEARRTLALAEAAAAVLAAGRSV